MGPGSFDKQIQQLRARVGKFRKRISKPADRDPLAIEAVAELSNALEELRVSNEELNRHHEVLQVAHLERDKERQRYQDLFQAAPDGYFITDVTGRVTEVNDAALRLLGITARTIVGTPLALRVVTADIPLLIALTRSQSDTAVRNTELRIRRRGIQGSFPASVSMTVITSPSGAVLGRRWLIHDLTTLKEQEERVRQSETLLRTLVDGARDFAIFRLDVMGRVTSWNVGAERIFGYRAEDVLGQSFERLRAPDDSSTSEKQLLARADRYGRSEVEGWHLHKSGSRLWTNSVITPLRDDRGNLTGFVRVLRDVTDRRRTEEALAERSRLSALEADIGTALTAGGDLATMLQRCASAILVDLGAALVRIWTLDEGTETLELQACAGDHSAQDRLPKAVPLNSPVEVARVARRRRPHVTDDLLSESDLSCRKWAKRKGASSYAGHPLILDRRLAGVVEIFSVHALGEASHQAMESLARSIALGVERLRAEERLSRTLQELEQIMETTPDVIFTLDSQGRLIQWNRKLEAVSGLSREQLAGRSIVDLVPENEARLVEERIAAAWAQGSAEWEGHVRRPDASSAPISWALASRRDARQEVVGLTGSGRDISERREAEMRLAQLSRHLLHLREEEQRRISRELHDSTAQNLAALCMNVAMLRKPEAKLDEASLRKVEETAELANRCLSEVRTIAYLLHPPLLDEVGLTAALRWYTNGFSQRSGVKTDIDLPGDLGRLDQDLELALFRIVQETLTNVHRHAQAGAVRVGLQKTKASIVLEVADDGCGIAAVRGAGRASKRRGTTRGRSAKDRLATSPRTDIEWMGLGLMGIHERVQERLGRFEIESGTGGTTVRVELPIKERAVS